MGSVAFVPAVIDPISGQPVTWTEPSYAKIQDYYTQLAQAAHTDAAATSAYDVAEANWESAYLGYLNENMAAVAQASLAHRPAVPLATVVTLNSDYTITTTQGAPLATQPPIPPDPRAGSNPGIGGSSAAIAARLQGASAVNAPTPAQIGAELAAIDQKLTEVLALLKPPAPATT